jgi:hypothetical protein
VCIEIFDWILRIPDSPCDCPNVFRIGPERSSHLRPLKVCALSKLPGFLKLRAMAAAVVVLPTRCFDLLTLRLGRGEWRATPERNVRISEESGGGLRGREPVI